MSDIDILRPLTVEEKRDMTPLNAKTLIDYFLAKVAKKVTEYQKKKRPYDSYGARMDFEANVQAKKHEMISAIDKSSIAKLDFGDLDVYADPARFTFIEKKEELQIRLVVGIKQEVSTGYRYFFKATGRGNKLSIVIRNDELEDFEQWFEEYFGEKKEVKENTEKVTKQKTTK